MGCAKTGLAQKEAYNWNFGSQASITFNTIPPTGLTTSKISSNYGSASMSNGKGRLLFYTNGEKVWDSTNSVTPHGSGLKGSNVSTQAALIIPRPDSTGFYYIFTVGLHGDTNGLCVSEYRMSLNSGKGDVDSSKKNIRLRYPVGEKLTSVKHKNGKDYWVLAYPLNSDTVYSYLITSAGISSTIVKSKTGLFLKTTFGGSYNAVGSMKISPDGSKFAVTVFNKDTFAVGDFNTITGKVSSVWKIYHYAGGLNVEFSPKSKFLYIVGSKTSDISQFDLSKTTASSFFSSRVAVAKYGWYYGGLQLGPDGKIYTNRSGNDSLDVIHFPDSSGKKCGIQYNYINLKSKSSRFDLPNFIQSYFDPNYLYKRNCLNDTTFMWPKVISGLDSVKWDFGDTASGSSNYSNSKLIAHHIYKKSGVYKVKYYSFFGSIRDTTIVIIPIKDAKPKIGNDTFYCNSFSIKLSPQKNYLTYKWSTGDNVKTITIKAKGTYILTATDSALCVVSDTIELKNPIVTAKFTPGDTMMCNTSTTIEFKNKSIFKDDSLKSMLWKISDNTTYTDSVFKKSFTTVDSFRIKLSVLSINGCKDSLAKNVLVYHTPKADFSINTSPQCLKGNNFVFTNSSAITKGFTYSNWYFGDGGSSSAKSPSKTYSSGGNYTVNLVETSNFGCFDTISKSIVVFHSSKVGFTINYNKQCIKNNQFTFSDTTSDSLVSISRVWHLGDNSVYSSQSVSKTYPMAGTYVIKLVVTTKDGCKDSVTKTINVYPQPNLGFTINDTLQCLTDNWFQFIDTTNQKVVSYTKLWNLGDGTTSSLFNVFKQYSKSGNFNIKLKITTKDGCKDSVIKPISINHRPIAKIFIGKQKECFKSNLFEFIDTTTIISGNTNIEWDFGDGNTSSSKKILKKYSDTGTYKVRLVSSSNSGCTDTTYRTVNVWPEPVSDFSIPNNDQCLKSNRFIFNNNSSLSTGTLKYKWLFGDNDSSVLKNPIKSYLKVDTFNITLISISNNSCTDTAKAIAVTRPQPIPSFEISDTSQCLDSNTFIFTNTSKINYGKLTYKWTLGDGNVSNIESLQHKYFASGKYNSKLIAISDYNCRDSVSQQLAVYNRPVISLSVKKDSIFCEGESAILTASGAISYIWSNSNQNDWINVNTSGKYSVIGISNGCNSQQLSVNIRVNSLPAKPIISKIGNDTLKSSYTFGNQWRINGNLIIGANNQYYSTLMDGKFNVEHKNSNGCISISDTFNFKKLVGINNVKHHSGYSIYPNPTYDNITILFEYPTWINIGLYDFSGRLISESDSNYSSKITLLMNHLSKGIYYLKVGNTFTKVHKY
jgi:PKD repeat protein